MDTGKDGRKQSNKESEPNSLRPVRVGVEGSPLGVSPKVTLFPGVRAKSLASCTKKKERKTPQKKCVYGNNHMYDPPYD